MPRLPATLAPLLLLSTLLCGGVALLSSAVLADAPRAHFACSTVLPELA